MKTRYSLLAAVGLFFILNACKKENTKPADTSVPPKPLTTFQMLAGKWTIIKDSVKTFDFQDRIPNFRNLQLDNNNFIVFNDDSTGTISSQTGHEALYTDYAQLLINPEAPTYIADLSFKYQVSKPDSFLPPVLSIPDIAPTIGITYRIDSLSTNKLILHYETNIAKFPHDYVIKEDIYLVK